MKLKNLDAFGHKVGLRFNNGAAAHRTSIGGFMSVSVILLVLIYTGLLIKKMVNYEGDIIFASKSLISYEEVGEITLTEADAYYYMVVQNAQTDMGFPYDEEMQKYISITATIATVNWAAPNPADLVTHTNIPMSACTVDMFPQDEKSIEKFYSTSATNPGLSMLCIDHDLVTLEGEFLSTVLSKQFVWSVQYCLGDHCEKNQNKVKEYINSISINMWSIQQSLDMSIRGSKPVFTKNVYESRVQLDRSLMVLVQQRIKQVSIKRFDDLFSLNLDPIYETFFEPLITDTTVDKVGNQKNPYAIMNFVVTLADEQSKTSRKVYNVVDLLSELGGILGVLRPLMLVLVGPISNFSFKMKALQKVFIARTNDNNLFKADTQTKVQKIQTPFVMRDTKVEEEVQKHYRIKLSSRQKFTMFWLNMCGCLKKCFAKPGSNNEKLMKLFKLGSDRLHNDLSMEKIVKSIRDMKILLKNKFMDDDLKFQIYHNRKNVIDLEDEDVKDCDIQTSGSVDPSEYGSSKRRGSNFQQLVRMETMNQSERSGLKKSKTGVAPVNGGQTEMQDLEAANGFNVLDEKV